MVNREANRRFVLVDNVAVDVDERHLPSGCLSSLNVKHHVVVDGISWYVVVNLSVEGFGRDVVKFVVNCWVKPPRREYVLVVKDGVRVESPAIVATSDVAQQVADRAFSVCRQVRNCTIGV